MTAKFLSPIIGTAQSPSKGKMFLLVDDKNRENEGDLIISTI